MSTLIRALTIQQPWALCIARGWKPVENRKWKPPEALVGGYLAIHAGRDEADGAAGYITTHCGVPVPPRHTWARGAVIAVARLAQVLPNKGPHAEGNPWVIERASMLGWWLEDVVAIEPVPCRGQQGLWQLEPHVLELVRERWREARVLADEERLDGEQEEHLLAIRAEARGAPAPTSAFAPSSQMPARLPPDPPAARIRCACGLGSYYCPECGRCQHPGSPRCGHGWIP